MNRTLGSIYEPRTDPEKERLLERIEELERMQQQKQEPLSGMEEKMALMEKSYELAAKYNNRQAVETPSPVRKAEDKKAIPVKQVHNEVVSSLSRPVSDEEFISAFSGERNAGFNTAVGRKTVTKAIPLPPVYMVRRPYPTDRPCACGLPSLCPLPDVSYRKGPYW